MRSATTGISTILSIALCLITSSFGCFSCGWVCSFACSWLCSFCLFSRAARGQVLSLISFSPPHVLHVDEVLIFGVHACTVLREALAPLLRGHHSHCCEALFPRASRPMSRTSSLRSCTVALHCCRGPLAGQANLLSAIARHTSATSDSCSRHCILLTRCLVVSGHHSTSSRTV